MADTAIGGKNGKKETGSNTLCPAADRRDRCCGLGSPYSKPGTAEDRLPCPFGYLAASGRQQMERTKYSRRFTYYATRGLTLVGLAG
jgi:hypothetical protein